MPPPPPRRLVYRVERSCELPSRYTEYDAREELYEELKAVKDQSENLIVGGGSLSARYRYQRRRAM